MASRLVRIFDDQTGEVPTIVGDPNPQSPPQLISGYAGGSTGLIKGSGNVAGAGVSAGVQISSAGVQPGSTANDNVLAIFTLPASFFEAALRGLNILAMGTTVANTNTKTLKLIMNPTAPVVGSAVSGGTTIASIALSTAAGGGGWQLEANIYKYGAAGSNTQIALHSAGQGGNVVASLAAPSLLTLPENATITVVVTGNAATSAADILFNFLEIFAMN